MSAKAEGSWLADMLRRLLHEKYGPKIPGVRRISADIAEANDGRTISHGHIHNMLTGTADNLTDHTRGRLARFFGRDPAYFHPPTEPGSPEPGEVRALAARLATFEPAQVDAIMRAVEELRHQGDSEP